MKHLVVPVLLAETGFFIAVGYVISTRLDEAAVTLLSGVLIGTLIGAPIAGLATYTVLRAQGEPHLADRQIASVPHTVAPVQTVSHPPLLTQQSDAFEMRPTRRRFYVIGEDGTTSELLPDGTHKAVTYIDEPLRL